VAQYEYPDEPTWWANYETEVEALFAEAGQAFTNPQAFRWFARPAYDIGAGMEPDAARRKHLRALREALGLPFEPPVGGLVRRVIAGKFFALETGEPWTMIQCSDFNLLGRYVAGEDIAPILAQRGDVGFNALRVWTAYDVPGIGRLVPSGAMYGAVPGFLSVCAAFGLYVELTAFTGPYSGLFDGQDAMVAHWEALQNACSLAVACDPSLELVNEWNNTPNKGLPFDRLRQVMMLIGCHGSSIADGSGLQPNWDYGTYHSNGLSEWQRKVGHNAMELADKYGIPWTSNENTRFPDRDDSHEHAYDAAAGAALLCAGACFHSVRGKSSELWDGLELECARSWATGAWSVPLDFQRGVYHHRTNLEGPGIIRAYDRRLADGREFVIMIRA